MSIVELLTDNNKLFPPSDYGLRLFPRQIFPTLWLAPHTKYPLLNCYYKVGSGKTHSAAYLTNLFFQYLTEDQNIYILTVLANINDFYDSLAQLFYSKTKFDEYIEKKKERLINPSLPDPRKAFKNNDLGKRVKIITHQKFEQLCFGIISKDEVNKENLKNLKINEKIVKQLTGSLLIIDEFQMCYSMEGWNTYGGTIKVLLEQVQDLKLLTLSGTFFNSIPLEFLDICDILKALLPFKVKTRDDFQGMISYNESTQSVNINKDLYKQFIDYIKEFSKDMFSFYMPNQKENMPELRMMGEILNKNTKIKFSKMKLTNAQQETIDDMGSNESMYELVIPNSNGKYSYKYSQIIGDYQKNKQFYNEQEIYFDFDNTKLMVGDFFNFDNPKGILKYSCVLQQMKNILMKKDKYRPSKKLFYSENINELNGIKQYESILKQNGFVSYDNQIISPNSVCLKCKKKYSNHGVKHEFKPYIFTILTGEISQNKRDKIRQIFNSPENINGELINFLFISAVANIAITFQAVGLLTIISVIPNISLLQQIIGRVVRTNSHALLPKEKQFVEVEILLAQRNDDKGLTKEENNYIRKEMYYNLINDINEIIADNAVDCEINKINNIDTFDKKIVCKCKDITLIPLHNILMIEIKKAIKYLFKDKIILLEDEIINLIKDDKLNLISWNINKYSDKLIIKALHDVVTVYSDKFINIDNFKNDKIYEDNYFSFRVIRYNNIYFRIEKNYTKFDNYDIHLIYIFNIFSKLQNNSQMIIDNYLTEITSTNLEKNIIDEINKNKNITYLKTIFNNYITNSFGIIDKLLSESILYYKWVNKKYDGDINKNINEIYPKLINYMNANDSLLYNDMEPSLNLYPFNMTTITPLILKPFNINPTKENYSLWKKINYLEKLLNNQLPEYSDISGFTLGNVISDLDNNIYKIIHSPITIDANYVMKYNINSSRIDVSYRGYFSVYVKNIDVTDRRYKKTGRNLLYFTPNDLNIMYNYLKKLYIEIFKEKLPDQDYKKYLISIKEKKNIIYNIQILFFSIQLLKEHFNLPIPDVYIRSVITKIE
jgi:hypothetical protein